MHTSPDHDARLLPWIDATGKVVQYPAATVQNATGHTLARTEEQIGYDRLMACLMHSDDVRCEVCGDDQ